MEIGPLQPHFVSLSIGVKSRHLLLKCLSSSDGINCPSPSVSQVLLAIFHHWNSAVTLWLISNRDKIHLSFIGNLLGSTRHMGVELILNEQQQVALVSLIEVTKNAQGGLHMLICFFHFDHLFVDGTHLPHVV
jgi:hypothetical protein